MTVTLLDVLAAGRARQASVVAETAGSVVLALADQVVHLPRRLTAAAIELLPEGGLRLDGGEATSEATSEQALRRLLRSLLELSRGTAPGLSRVGARPARGNLPALVHELEVALVPVNRSAGRRALARLHRETLRALGGGIPASAAQWARSVAEAVHAAAPVVADAAVAVGPSPIELRRTPIAGDGDAGPGLLGPRGSTPAPLPGRIPPDLPEDLSAPFPAEDVTDRAPMALLEEEGAVEVERTVAISSPVPAPFSARPVNEPSERAPAAEPQTSREITAPLPMPPSPSRRVGEVRGSVDAERASVPSSEEATVPLPSRARRRGAGIASASGVAASAGPLPGTSADGPEDWLAALDRRWDDSVVPAGSIPSTVAAVPECGGGAGESDGSDSKMPCGPCRRSAIPREHSAAEAAGAGARQADPWGDWRPVAEPFVSEDPPSANPERSVPPRDEGTGGPGSASIASLLAHELRQGDWLAGEEQSVSWIAPRVAAPLPGVVTADLETRPPTPMSSDPRDLAEPSPGAPRSRPSWRVRPTAGVFAPVASDVDDLVARFATGSAHDAAVVAGLAALIDTEHSPAPGSVQPWPLAPSARRPGAGLGSPRTALGRGSSIALAPPVAVGRSR